MDHQHHHETAAAPAAVPSTSAAKRQSAPFPPLLFHQPHPEKTLHSLPSPSAAAGPIPEYKKLELPLPFLVASPPPLRCTMSEPVSPTINARYFSVSPPHDSDFPFSPVTSPTNQKLPENANWNVAYESVPFQSTLSAIHRGMFDLNLVANQQPFSPVARNDYGSPSCGERPRNKSLKRKRERIREMSHWGIEIVSGGDEGENYINDNIPKEESEGVIEENPGYKAMSVETKGESTFFHFECPCGHGHEFVRSGSHLYYKRT